MNQEFQNKDKANGEDGKYDNDKLLEVGKNYVRGVEDLMHKMFIMYEIHLNETYPNKTITELMNNFNNSEVNEHELTNAQKFRILGDKESKDGDEEVARGLYKTADSYEKALKFLGDLSLNSSDYNLNDHDES